MRVENSELFLVSCGIVAELGKNNKHSFCSVIGAGYWGRNFVCEFHVLRYVYTVCDTTLGTLFLSSNVLMSMDVERVVRKHSGCYKLKVLLHIVFAPSIFSNAERNELYQGH